MNFELKEWSMEYAPDIVKYAGNPKIAQNLSEGFPSPFTLETARAFIESCIEQEGITQCSRAIIVNGEAIGNIAVFFGDNVYRRSGKIAYWLGEPFWKHGITSSAIKQLSDYIFDTYDICRISAEPFAYNTGSKRALEKAGFELEGILRQSVFKNNQMFDSYLYALTKNQ